ncbi:MAG TPA: tRNA pseudouridine(38-40) synthase TruA [Flavobacterium sp.]
MRYFIEFTYNGTAYHGWQKQRNVPSVQQTLEEALTMLLRETIETTGAGRTDTGVHASQAFAHFDCSGIPDVRDLAHRLNSCLPKDIAVQAIIPLHADAHARFDAKKRTYHYHIHQFKDVFAGKLSWEFAQQLDVDKMNEAAQVLFNYDDFQCFSKVDTDVHSFICHIYEAEWTQGQNRLMFTISADRFLRNMVRAIVGTLIDVGRNRISVSGFEAIIKSKDRTRAGFSVPAHGLYLQKIEYDYIDSRSPDRGGILLQSAAE